MSKAKLEKDFQEFNLQIEKLAEEEVKEHQRKGGCDKGGSCQNRRSR